MVDEKVEEARQLERSLEVERVRNTRVVNEVDMLMVSQRMVDTEINKYITPSFKLDSRAHKKQAKTVQHLTLTISEECSGASRYSCVQGRITKESEETGVLMFNEQVNGGDSVSFGVRVESELTNNWLVLGIMPPEMARRPFCYFIKNTIAYSGSIGTLFLEMDSMDLNLRPNKGDTLTVEVNGREGTMGMFFNRQLVCIVRIPKPMNNLRLQPYLMLAHRNDTLSLI